MERQRRKPCHSLRQAMDNLRLDQVDSAGAESALHTQLPYAKQRCGNATDCLLPRNRERNRNLRPGARCVFDLRAARATRCRRRTDASIHGRSLSDCAPRIHASNRSAFDLPSGPLLRPPRRADVAGSGDFFMPKSVDSFDLEAFRLPESYLSQTKKSAPAGRRESPKFPGAKGFKFYMLPAKLLEDIATGTRCPALIILCVMNRLWFQNSCHNPVRCVEVPKTPGFETP